MKLSINTFYEAKCRTAVSSKNFHEILAGCSLSCPFFHLPKKSAQQHFLSMSVLPVPFLVKIYFFHHILFLLKNNFLA